MNKKITLRVVLLFLLWMPALLCNLGMLGCGGVVGTSSATDSDTASDLTSADSQLYSDGPIDLPVTIAKLDTPDLTKITVTVEELSTPSLSPPLATTATHRFTITGIAGAATTAKVTVFDLDSDEQVTSDVESDGSFSIQIDGTLTDTLAFAGANSTVTQITPFVVITVDSTGNPVMTVSNTDSLNTNQNLIVDELGNYYVSVLNADGTTYTLLQRNADGTQLEVISSTLASEPRMVAANGEMLTVVLQDGTLLVLAAPLAALMAPSLSKPQPAYTEWTSTTLVNIIGGLPEADDGPLSQFGFNLLLDPLGRSLAGSTAATHPVTGTVETNLLSLFDVTAVGGDSYYLAAVDTYFQIRIAKGPNSKLYFALQNINSTTTEIYRMDFISPGVGDVALAWDEKETVLSGLAANGSVLSFNVADNGDIAYTYVNESGGGPAPIFSAYWNATTGETSTIVDDTNTTQYMFATILPGSEAVVLCEPAAVGATGVYSALVYWRPGDATNELNDLVRFTDQSTCTSNDGGFSISSENLLYFYNGSETVSSQLSVINLNQVLDL